MKTPIIQTKNATYEYFRRDTEGNVEAISAAISNLNIEVAEGSFLSIVGANGSGKSTLARLLNALNMPTEGTVYVNGHDTKDMAYNQEIHQTVGVVFQNPDNQIVGTTLESDTAFGLENLKIESKKIRERVDDTLKIIGLDGYQTYPVSKLSGGQKQKAALAGVLAMKPRCIILDEATAMLDPVSRHQIMELVQQLHRKYHITIIQITHFMEEVQESEYVFALADGQLVFSGTPDALFANAEVVSRCALRLPLSVELKQAFAQHGILDTQTLSQQILVQSIRIPDDDVHECDPRNALIFDHVSFHYRDQEPDAVADVSLTAGRGECLAICGHTGSGKSTLLQMANGLQKPTAGSIYYQGKDIWEKGYSHKLLRQKVGLVFQYPEHQLFGENVYKDVVFGPYHMDISKVEAEKRAFEAIWQMGLPDDIYDVSPFALSGGQQRRVAIAGVIAMQPEILILDEPTAGLDPAGQEELWDCLEALKRMQNMGIVVVSHNMDEVARHADRMLVMNHGKPWMQGSVRQCFDEIEQIKQAGLMPPAVSIEAERLRQAGLPIPRGIIKKEELFAALGWK